MRFKGMASLALAALVLATTAYAEKAKKKSPEEQAWEEGYQKQKTKEKELDNSEWDVTLVPDDPKDKTQITDKLIFKGGTLTLKSFESLGFSPVGFTVTIHPDGGAHFESFQEREKKGSLSIRGEWKEELMSGAVGYAVGEDKNRKIKTYYFSNAPKKLLEAQEKPKKQGATSVAPQTKALVSK